jgi:putative ABC transport system permease protein
MLKILVKNVWVNIGRQRLCASLNIAGLGIGLACCLVIALFVSHELSYEKHYRFASRLYLLEQSRARDQIMMEQSSFLAAPLLAQDFPAIERTARYTPRTQPAIVAFENLRFREEELRYADASFLELFDFVWLAGDPSQALQDPRSIVLTESFARKYFGSTDALGKTLLLDDEYDLRVTGVIADLPGNTHIQFTALSTIAMFETVMGKLGANLQSWGTAITSTYLLLREDAAVEDLRAQLPAFSARHLARQAVQRSFNPRPITDLYLNGSFQEQAATGIDNRERVRLFAALALCILVIAIINFMNLSTARSAQRAREVGLKLSLGASRAQLVGQFLGESVFMTACAMLVALAFVEIALPPVERLTGLDLASQLPAATITVALLAAATLAVGIIAGAYPAHYLSGYRPSRVLKGELDRGKTGALFRKVLVVFQFTISIALIVATIVIFRQMQLARDIETGFRRELVYNIALPYAADFDMDTRWPILQAALAADARITAVTQATSTPLMQNRIGIFARKPDEDSPVRLELVQGDADYLQSYDISLLAGDYLSEATGTDGLVINALAARQLQWSPAEAIGKTLLLNDKVNRVVGVVADTIHDVREEPLPQVYTVVGYVPVGIAGGQMISLRIEAGDVAGALAHIAAVWRSQFPNEIPQGIFLDDQFNAQYRGEDVQGQLFSIAALLAVLVASFGLFGLASFNAECRIKEIGVRKVMGSGVWSIVLLLTNDFSKLVLLSNLIAWPVAYVAMQRWLENFAYRIDLTPLIFIGSGAIALCVAWVTVGGIAARAASAKPVLALRYE